MIIDSHMNVGDFPLFSLSIDRAGSIDSEAPVDVAARNPDVYRRRSGYPRARRLAKRSHAWATTGSATARIPHSIIRRSELAKVRVSGLSTDLTHSVRGENGRRLFLGELMPEAVTGRYRSGKCRVGSHAAN